MPLFSFFDKKPSKYDSVEFGLATGQSNYSLSANQAAWHANEKKPYGGLYIVTDQTVTVKFNSSANPGVTVTSSQSPFMVDFLAVSDIFISNASGSTANIKILAVHV